jgi:hypothetical protein
MLLSNSLRFAKPKRRVAASRRLWDSDSGGESVGDVWKSEASVCQGKARSRECLRRI